MSTRYGVSTVSHHAGRGAAAANASATSRWRDRRAPSAAAFAASASAARGPDSRRSRRPRTPRPPPRRPPPALRRSRGDAAWRDRLRPALPGRQGAGEPPRRRRRSTPIAARSRRARGSGSSTNGSRCRACRDRRRGGRPSMPRHGTRSARRSCSAARRPPPWSPRSSRSRPLADPEPARMSERLRSRDTPRRRRSAPSRTRQWRSGPTRNAASRTGALSRSP